LRRVSRRLRAIQDRGVLRKARESAGLTQEELALRLKTKKTAISRIENTRKTSNFPPWTGSQSAGKAVRGEYRVVFNKFLAFPVSSDYYRLARSRQMFVTAELGSAHLSSPRLAYTPLRPGEDQSSQFPWCDGNFSCDPLPDPEVMCL